MTHDFGKLEFVDIDKEWTSEAGDFTPWLASTEGVRLLSDAIGFELSNVQMKLDAGAFEADIVATKADTGETVVIENQFGETNHDHLGKMITYSAVLGASALVWISEEFREEHRRAIQFLNQSSRGVSYFGIEVKLVKIDNSKSSPLLTVIGKPDEFTKTVAAASKPWTTDGKAWHFGGNENWEENISLIKALADRFEEIPNVVPDWNLKLYVRFTGPSKRKLTIFDQQRKGRIDIVFEPATYEQLLTSLQSQRIQATVEKTHPLAGEVNWVGVETVDELNNLIPALKSWLQG